MLHVEPEAMSAEEESATDDSDFEFEDLEAVARLELNQTEDTVQQPSKTETTQSSPRKRKAMNVSFCHE